MWGVELLSWRCLSEWAVSPLARLAARKQSCLGKSTDTDDAARGPEGGGAGASTSCLQCRLPPQRAHNPP